ncbi:MULTISPECIES: hypothetical protein [Actinosynnema]|uniref:hypothetical protein n=1 Tax=Actinosynnema TaxID=40566 RepID=UPI0020A3943E|nr:hypothetical protein [Actinosynnema pretiosum]MCP2096056.1 hypothetical protein [Actinosynnema pretiosum]
MNPVPWSQTTALVVAQQPRENDPGGQKEDFGKSSPVGLLMLVLLLASVFLLVRSMNKKLKKLPVSFGAEGADGAGAEAKEPVAANAGASVIAAGKAAAKAAKAEKKAGGDSAAPAAEAPEKD